MKQVAFFTAIINILTEDTLRRSSVYDGSLGFNDDPRGLVYVFDDNKHIIGAPSRRFDGAYPNILNPRIVWEIKEYHYTYMVFAKNFADDGVYRLTFHSEDAAGNVAENTLDTKDAEVGFGVDATKPNIVVENLENGVTYGLLLSSCCVVTQL